MSPSHIVSGRSGFPVVRLLLLGLLSLVAFPLHAGTPIIGNDPPKRPNLAKETQALLAYLKEPTDRLRNGIEGLTLDDALAFIGKAHAINIRIDEKGFKADRCTDVGKEIVSLPPVRGMPLETILKDLLSRLKPEATFLVQGDHVVVVSKAALERGEMLQERVHAAYENKPLDEVLQELSDKTAVTVLVDPRLGNNANTRITATLRGVPLRTAVELLADMAGATAIVRGEALYVTTRENAQALEQAQKPNKAASADPTPKPEQP